MKIRVAMAASNQAVFMARLRCSLISPWLAIFITVINAPLQHAQQ
jgi:hypothetical protein